MWQQIKSNIQVREVILVGVCHLVLQILTLFKTKKSEKCHFLHPFSDQKKKPYPFSDLAFRQKLCHHHLD